MITRRIYLATSWKNGGQPFLVDWLRDSGHRVYDFRNPSSALAGFSWTELDPDWEDWTPNEYREKLINHPRAAQGFTADQRAMAWCDTCVMYLPCGNSAHLELGWCAGQGKHTIIYMEENHEVKPDLMYLLADNIAIGLEELGACLV